MLRRKIVSRQATFTVSNFKLRASFRIGHPLRGPQNRHHRSTRASSQYGDDSWSATQATGAPNVTTCADDTKAWAAASSNTVEWIELIFAVPVAPSQVNVHISYNPTYITKMELIDLDGVSHQIYGFEARS
jgi:hypothetical protein